MAESAVIESEEGASWTLSLAICFYRDEITGHCSCQFNTPWKEFREEIRNKALCTLGTTGRKGLQRVRYSQENTFSSVQFSHSVMSDSLRPHESQHARPPCPSPNPGVHWDSPPLSQWCHPAISSSVVPFSSCPQSLPASASFPMSQLFTSGGQSTGVSALASVLPKNTQGWSPSEWTVWISLQSKGLSRVFSNTTVQKHQFFGAQPSSQSNSHIHTLYEPKFCIFSYLEKL